MSCNRRIYPLFSLFCCFPLFWENYYPPTFSNFPHDFAKFRPTCFFTYIMCFSFPPYFDHDICRFYFAFFLLYYSSCSSCSFCLLFYTLTSLVRVLCYAFIHHTMHVLDAPV